MARKEGLIEVLPLRKKKKEMEIWVWNAEILEDGQKLAFVNNEYAPFLKKTTHLTWKSDAAKIAASKI